MGAGRPLAVVVVLAALVLPSPSVARIYDPVGKCVDRAGIGGYDRVERRADYEVYGRGSSRRVAEEAAGIISGERFWSTLAARFGQPRRELGPDGRPLRYQIFVTSESLGDAAGLNARYCGSFSADAVLVAADLDRRELAATVAHELFHAFSAGVGGSLIGEWWGEATATWGEMQLARDERRVRQLDRQFLQRPDLPINRPIGDPDGDDRPYGAWRFVEWLWAYLGGDDGLYPFMADTFRRMGAPVGGEDATRAVRNQLAVEGRDLGEDLGQFWGERLYPANPLTGPRTEGQRVIFPSEEPPGGGLTEIYDLPAEQLSADVGRFRLPRDSHVQRISISAEAAPPGTYLWVQDGRDLENWSEGDFTHFCVGGPSPSLGAKAWPGEFPVAFTNGNSEPPRPVLSTAITIEVSAEECPGFVPDPSAAIDESPVLELPDRCPAEPVYFDPPMRDPPAEGFHTDYFVFRERITTVYESQSDWTRAAVAEIDRRDLGRRAAGRLIARWVYCAARRARDIDHLPETDGEPDALLRRARGKFVALTRRAASRYERGELFGATDFTSEAARQYVQIIGRCTVQDIATAG